MPPRLSDPLEAIVDTTVIVNRPVTLSCAIEAEPSPTITWFKVSFRFVVGDLPA